MTVEMSKQLLATAPPDLSRPARALYRELSRLAGDTPGEDGRIGYVRWGVTTEQLMTRLDYKRSAVNGARRELVARGLVELVRVGTGRQSSCYRVAVPWADGQHETAGELALATPRVPIRDTQGADPRHPGCQTATPSTRGRAVPTGYGTLRGTGLDEVPPPPADDHGRGAVAADDGPEVEGVDRGETHKIVEKIRAIRPEWSRRSIRRALAGANDRPWPIVRAAIELVAADPHSLAPGRLRHDGPWWTQAADRQLTAQRRRGPAWCGECESETYRWREAPDGKLFRCPACNPDALAEARSAAF